MNQKCHECLHSFLDTTLIGLVIDLANKFQHYGRIDLLLLCDFD